MKCKNNKKYKILGFILIMFFSFIFIDNVNALECKYWYRHFDGVECKSGYTGGQLGYWYSNCGENPKTPYIVTFKNTINNWQYVGFSTQSRIANKPDGKGIYVKNEGIIKDNSYKVSECPQYINFEYGSDFIEEMATFTKDEYKKITGNEPVKYPEKKMYGSQTYEYVYVDYLKLPVYNNNFYGGVVKYNEMMLTLSPYIKKRADLPPTYYLEPPYLESLRKDTYDIVGKLVKASFTDKKYGTFGDEKCPLKSLKADNSNSIKQIKTYIKSLDSALEITNSIDSLVSVATDEKKGVVTSPLLGSMEPITLHNLASNEANYKKIGDYPEGYNLKELVDGYKSFAITNQPVRQHLDAVSNCFVENSSRLYKEAQAAKKSNKISDSEFKTIKSLTEKTTKLKETLAKISKTQASADQAVKDSIVKEEYKTCDALLSKEFMDYVKWAYNVIEIGAVVLTVVLGMLDFTKAVAVSEDGALKKAGKKFLKRVIAVVIIILLPILINFILSVFNIKGIYGTDDKCIEMSD